MTTQDLKKLLIKETNKGKLTYHQLNHMFREVRKSCDIPTPKNNKPIFELPTHEEISDFYNNATPFHKLIFKTLQGTGLRVSELCNLEVKDIDFDNNKIFVRQAKGGQQRYTYFGNKLKEKLLLYLSQKRRIRYLFESNRCTKFSTRMIQIICKKYKEKSKIDKKFTVHTFRHIWNTNLAENEISAEHRAYLAGHLDIASQDIYTHITAGGIKDKLIKILDKEIN